MQNADKELIQSTNIVRAQAAAPAETTRRFLAAPDPSAVMPFRDGEGMRFLLLRYASPGAAALQLYFSSIYLPAGARVFVYGSDAEGSVTNIAGPYEGVGPLHSGEFWSAAVRGDHAVVELQIPPGEQPPDLPFRISELAHLDAYIPTYEGPAPEPEGFRTSIYRGMPLTHAVVNGEAVFEGDIILGRADDLRPATGAGGKDARRESIGRTGSQYRWPNGVMPYVISSTLPNLSRVTSAISHWNTALGGTIQLVPRTNESSYVTFVQASSAGTCSSSVGMVGGAQSINVGDYCSAGNIIHEIGHAFGLWHEHTREDRNTFVIINWANIQPSATYNFDQQILYGDDIGSYDYGSVMHCSAYAFSDNGLPTIETIPAGIPIGQRSGLSSGDINGIRTMYTAPLTSATAAVNVTLGTNPQGQVIAADSVDYVGPVTLGWVSASTHPISAKNSTAVNGTRYQWIRWSDGGAQTHTVTAPYSPATLAADYGVAYQLSAAASPYTGGTVAFSPSSLDGFYPANAAVNLSAPAASGYCFTSWTGLLAGTPPQTTISMTGPYTLTANFQTGVISPQTTRLSIGRSGGTLQLPVSATPGCQWPAVSNDPWITVASPRWSTSSGTVTLSVAPYSGKNRNGSISVNRTTVRVTQR
ncbi:MAG: hypothetical protein HYZ57_05490 [Acidobacteria bacterium]|nr:hypothetical protein [Acidobacteriota bacterium]